MYRRLCFQAVSGLLKTLSPEYIVISDFFTGECQDAPSTHSATTFFLQTLLETISNRQPGIFSGWLTEFLYPIAFITP